MARMPVLAMPEILKLNKKNVQRFESSFKLTQHRFIHREKNKGIKKNKNLF